MAQELGPLARTVSVPYYDAALPAHDAFHAKRVRDVSVRLADEWERTVDTDVLSAAAWLHDVGRPLERTAEIDRHDRWAAEKAGELLAAEGVGTDRIGAIEHCIRSHSIRSSSPEPETAEAKLLFDADKLDATGAVGITRLACIIGERSGRAGERHAVIDEASAPDLEPSVPDVSLIREWARERLELLYTTPGRRLGESRWQFVEDFFDRFARETGRDADR